MDFGSLRHNHTLPWLLLPKQAIRSPREKVTNLHFYFHDTLSAKNPSAVLIARPNFTTAFNSTPIPFGSVYATYDPITVGPGLPPPRMC